MADYISKYENGKAIDDQLDKVDLCMRYDYVVDSQDKFDTMIGSDSWLGVVNVLIDGYYETIGVVKIPTNVKKIHGINNAKVAVTVNEFEGDPAVGCFYYETMPDSNEYEIRNLTVERIDNWGFFYGCFGRCINLYQCTAECSTYVDIAVGFNYCKNIVNCSEKCVGQNSCVCSFCEDIYNLETDYYIVNSTNVINCTSRSGFTACTNLQGCRSNSYESCSYCSNCRKIDEEPYMLWNGVTVKRDDDSCDLA